MVYQFKRDYKKEPLRLIQTGSIRRRELPYKEDVYYLYIDCNYSVQELSNYFKISYPQIQKMLSDYSIKKDRKLVYQKQKQTLLKTKGVENAFQLEDVKIKSKKTTKKRYGKEYFVQTEEYKKKNKKTRELKYGDDPYQRQKYKKTCFLKHGVENSNYYHFSHEQKEFLSNKDKVIKFIEDNNIQNALQFSNISGIKQFAGLTLLNKFDLMCMFKYERSTPEKELEELLTSWGVSFIRNFKLKNKKEIDIYIPDKKIGIEFNGNYWHSEMFRNMMYHQQKSLSALEEGIFVYHIFEYEWMDEKVKQRIINQLKNIFGLNKTKIYARNCIVREVERKEYVEFLNENHIQGTDFSTIKLGLYNQDKLVSLMSFTIPRFNKKYGWELSRFCSLAECNVIGGASKLFSHFVKTYHPKSIISYSDIAKTTGNMYETLGFKFKSIVHPAHVWYKSNEGIKTRFQTRKKELSQQGLIGKSESEIMHKLGFIRIYNCGNKVWEWLR